MYRARKALGRWAPHQARRWREPLIQLKPLLVAALAALVAGCGGAATQTAAKAPPAPQPVKELREPDPLLRDLIGFRVRYRDLVRRHDELVRIVDSAVPGAWDGTSGPPSSFCRAGMGRDCIRRSRSSSPRTAAASPAGQLHFWGGLPAFGPFAVVNPEGQGRRLTLYSWGWRGQIDDLARMPYSRGRAAVAAHRS